MKEEITNVINKILKPDNFKYYANYGYAYPLLATDADTIIEFIEKLEQENKSLQSQLKAKEDNWNKLKQDIGYELLKLREPNEYNNGLVNGINYVLNTMQELEILSKGENK